MQRSIPRPSWKADILEEPSVALDLLRAYVDNRRAFVVYSCGTAVFSDTLSARRDDEYAATLDAVGCTPPDFKVVPMKDGNYMIRFSGPVCGLVTRIFYAQHEAAIKDKVMRGGLLPGEVVLTSGGDQEVSAQHYLIGLYARAKLYRDIEKQAIAARFTPETT